MGQAKRRLRALLTLEKRCVYCLNAPDSIEHMPPRAMFINKSRPKGLEFASCKLCNEGTSAADLVASFFARLGSERDDQLIEEAKQRRAAVIRKAPGVIEEFFRPNKVKRILHNRNGILQRMTKVSADGPRTAAYLTVFTAKLGMSLFREHMDEPLPVSGGVHTQWFLNAGLAEEAAQALLAMLPVYGGLRQGSFEVRDQFGYRYNTDGKTIVASLASFHSNLWTFTIATSMPDKYLKPIYSGHTDFVRPGELLVKLPPRS